MPAQFKQEQTIPQASSIADIQSMPWNQLVALLELSGVNLELARNIQCVARNDSHWQFVIDEGLDYLSSPQTNEALAVALKRVCGASIDVKVKVKNAGAISGEQPENAIQTPAEEMALRAREKKSQAERAIEDDPTVISLQQEMGASLIEGSVKPLQ